MRLTALLAAALGLAACGSQTGDDGGTLGGSLVQVARQAIGSAGGGGAGAPAEAPRSAEQMAATALQVNPGPLVLAGLESAGVTQVLALTGENGAMRTYMTPNMEGVILRRGLLIGTRGIGNDLSTAEIGTEGLIRSRSAGSGNRIMRIYGGDGRELPLPMTCTVATGAGQSFSFAGTAWNATQVAETCRIAGAEVQNSYLVTAGGEIPVSRQWAGPGLGYITLQTIRP
ncbi:YjbF family lipoprotein [Paracoccus sp. S-4012]|uniref:YjbF family lipoprotein n=1 Tax=Paracoccus sp. S-4012 TaxID=2665648 RepID=UPI00351B380D